MSIEKRHSVVSQYLFPVVHPYGMSQLLMLIAKNCQNQNTFLFDGQLAWQFCWSKNVYTATQYKFLMFDYFLWNA